MGDPVVVYADASGGGHLGCVTFLDGGRSPAHTHSPSWFKALIPGIYEFELRAIIFGITIAAELAPGRPVLLCCDNMGVNGTIIRGASRTRLGRALCAVFWAFVAARGIRVWVEYAKSALNASDCPSRTCGIPAADPRMADTRPNEGAPCAFAQFSDPMPTATPTSTERIVPPPGAFPPSPAYPYVPDARLAKESIATRVRSQLFTV